MTHLKSMISVNSKRLASSRRDVFFSSFLYSFDWSFKSRWLFITNLIRRNTSNRQTCIFIGVVAWGSWRSWWLLKWSQSIQKKSLTWNMVTGSRLHVSIPSSLVAALSEIVFVRMAEMIEWENWDDTDAKSRQKFGVFFDKRRWNETSSIWQRFLCTGMGCQRSRRIKT